MARRACRTGMAVACVAWILWGATCSRAQAQQYTTTVIGSDADCDDDCDSGCCRGLSFCNKLRMHCIYHSRKCCRPYRRLDYIPPELAPYIGPGMWHSPGYGLPFNGAACPSAPYGYGAYPVGYAR